MNVYVESLRLLKYHKETLGDCNHPIEAGSCDALHCNLKSPKTKEAPWGPALVTTAFGLVKL